MFKPKLLPLKSMTLEKMERMQKEANEKAKEMQEEIEKEKQVSYDSKGSCKVFFFKLEGGEPIKVYTNLLLPSFKIFESITLNRRLNFLFPLCPLKQKCYMLMKTYVYKK